FLIIVRYREGWRVGLLIVERAGRFSSRESGRPGFAGKRVPGSSRSVPATLTSLRGFRPLCYDARNAIRQGAFLAWVDVGHPQSTRPLFSWRAGYFSAGGACLTWATRAREAHQFQNVEEAVRVATNISCGWVQVLTIDRAIPDETARFSGEHSGAAFAD